MGLKALFVCCGKDETRDKSDLPIDRGWAWVIILASAGIFAFNAGTYKCFGIIKLAVMDSFPDCSQDVSLWILSAASTMSLFFGPVVSIMLNHFSHRLVGVFGGALFSTGFVLTALAPNCYFLFFSFSFVYAIGGGTLLVVCFTSFAAYFRKHRALAVGIMASGSGLGGVVLPPLVTFLFDTLSFREAMLLYGGISLHIMIFVTLLRPMSYYEELAQKKARIRERRFYAANIEHADIERLKNEETFRERSLSQSNKTSCNRILDEEVLHGSLPYSLDRYTTQNNNKALMGEQLLGSALSLSAMPTVEGSIHLHDSNLRIDADTTGECPQDTPANEEKTPQWKIWIRPKVMLICGIMFFAMTANCLFISTTPSFGEEHGVTRKTLSIVMAVTSLVEVICRILSGWLADQKVMPAITQLSIVLFLSGISAVVCALVPGIVGICVFYSVIAVAGSSMFSLLPIVYIELEGISCLPAITGINNVYQAMAFLSSAPIANALHAESNSWLYVTYYIGACFTVAAAIGLTYSLSIRIKKK